jgi:hypothetical protein
MKPLTLLGEPQVSQNEVHRAKLHTFVNCQHPHYVLEQTAYKQNNANLDPKHCMLSIHLDILRFSTSYWSHLSHIRGTSMTDLRSKVSP